MARGQAIAIRCPECKLKGYGVKGLKKPPKRRHYSHGHCVGLPDSNWIVPTQCNQCGYEWYSRHPDAHWAYKRDIDSNFEDNYKGKKWKL